LQEIQKIEPKEKIFEFFVDKHLEQIYHPLLRINNGREVVAAK
jgi:hypothetical protein